MPSLPTSHNPLHELVDWHIRKPWQFHVSLGLTLLILLSISVLSTTLKTQAMPLPVVVTITAPTDGATLSGPVPLSATTTGGTSTALDFIISGGASTTTSAITSDGGATWTANLDSTGLGNGSYSMVASSTIDGSNVNSNPINFTISNGGGGGATVTVTNPADGSSPTGMLTLVATVTGGTATSLDFIADGTPAAATEGPPGTWTLGPFDSSSMSAGSHSLYAEATIGGSPVDSPTIHFMTSGNGVPTITITSPADGSTLPFGGSFVTTVTGGTPDDPGNINFLVDGQLLGGDASPFQAFETFTGSGIFEFSPQATVAPGAHSFVSIAKFGGVTIQSPPVTFTIVKQPTSVVVIPTDCATFKKGPVPLAAKVDGAIDSAKFLIAGFYPNNVETQNAEQFETPATFNAASGTWDGVWDASDVGIGTYAIFSSITANGNTLPSQASYVAIGMDCFFRTPGSTDIPVVTFTAPADGVTVSGTVPLVMTVAPTPAKAGFDIFKDNTGLPIHLDAVQQDTGWTAAWDTTKVGNGSYSIKPSALNAAGESFSGAAHALSVQNQTVTTTHPIVPNPPPLANLEFDPTATGTYSAEVALAANPTIDVALGIPALAGPALCTAGSLIKLPNDNNPNTDADTAVYYCGNDGKRYVFTNDKVFFSWYSDFSSVITVSADTMANIPLGGDITYRPGSHMVKITTDPKVYAVSRGSLLRWVATEDAAKRLYGADWNAKIDDISDAFFVNYTFGSAIR